jgi:hypothetical protein
MQSYRIVVPKSVDEFHHRAIIITFDSADVDEYTFKEELVRAVRAAGAIRRTRCSTAAPASR